MITEKNITHTTETLSDVEKQKQVNFDKMRNRLKRDKILALRQSKLELQKEEEEKKQKRMV